MLMKLFVNIDGASRGNPGKAAAAMVICDEAGRVLATKSKYLGAAVTNNYAEWSALAGAVKALLFLAEGENYLEAEIRSDSELVVRQFTRVYQIKSPDLRKIADSVWAALAAKQNLQISLIHVPREANRLADAAANRELDQH
jgi:ribonuclease HI